MGATVYIMNYLICNLNNNTNNNIDNINKYEKNEAFILDYLKNCFTPKEIQEYVKTRNLLTMVP